MMRKIKIQLGLLITLCGIPLLIMAQNNPKGHTMLTPKQQGLIKIASLAAKGDLSRLTTELNSGLNAGLTVSQIKEAIVHLYAYAGFPRSIRGLQTFMAVMDERKANGIKDVMGAEASPIKSNPSKYKRGNAVLEELTGLPETGPKTGYAAFAPAIEIFLKEHLFADLFERDVLTYAERELVTISVLSSIGGVDPMLRSHLTLCLNLGITPAQLQQFVGIIKVTLGDRDAIAAQLVLDEVLKNHKTTTAAIFPKGEKVTNSNFTGTVYVHSLLEATKRADGVVK